MRMETTIGGCSPGRLTQNVVVFQILGRHCSAIVMVSSAAFHKTYISSYFSPQESGAGFSHKPEWFRKGLSVFHAFLVTAK